MTIYLSDGFKIPIDKLLVINNIKNRKLPMDMINIICFYFGGGANVNVCFELFASFVCKPVCVCVFRCSTRVPCIPSDSVCLL